MYQSCYKKQHKNIKKTKKIYLHKKKTTSLLRKTKKTTQVNLEIKKIKINQMYLPTLTFNFQVPVRTNKPN